MPTIQDIKDDLRIEFEPVPVIESQHIELSVKDALRKYSAYNGIIKTFEKSYSDIVDLSGEAEQIINVVDVIPDQDQLIEFATVTENSHLLTESVMYPRHGYVDPNNKLTNWVQKLDLWEQIKGFLGHEPDFYFDDEKEKLYLDNYPSGMNTILVVTESEIPMNPIDDTYTITDLEAYDWILEYARVKLTLRQDRILGVETQGTPQIEMGIDDPASRKKEMEQSIKEQRDLIL